MAAHISQSGTRRRKARKGPAEGVILSKERARKASKAAGGGPLKNGFALRLTVHKELAFDLDMRKMVEHVTLGMGAYFGRQLTLGRRADGRGPLERVASKTPKFGARRSDRLGFRSGYMAAHWWLGKIRGSTISSSRKLKPYGGDAGPRPPHEHGGENGRAFTIQNLLNRKQPVDFQSVRGTAGQELQRLFDQAVNQGFGDVRTFATPRVRSGLLPEVLR
ncbi:MAG: hypothetical protein ACRBN8_22480 [Nannocystales bacterium]